MRVIAGSKRRIQLETPEGMETRPTQDRIKETLFNMIGPDLYDCSFLDIFAGSGQMGIEALSRGARQAVFIDSSRAANLAITHNLERTGLKDQSMVLNTDYSAALKKLSGQHFDYVFMDPPYNHETERTVLASLIAVDCIDSYSTVIVEASLETSFDYVSELGYTITKEKCYKTNKHIFLSRKD